MVYYTEEGLGKYMKKQKQPTKNLLMLFLLFTLTGISGCARKEPDMTLQEDTTGTEAEVEDKDLDDVQEPANEADRSEPVEQVPEEPDLAASETETAMQKDKDADALAFVEDMKIGWNLGNTFDAIDYGGITRDNELMYESCWSGAVTTKEMIDTLKEAGFQTIRIPVSWHNHLWDENNTISEPWLTRVQEVVDYAIEDDMYVIINIHHDTSVNYYYPSKEYLEDSTEYVADIWTQIADRFAEYDNHLIFEALNEPRLTGTEDEWWMDNVEKEECVDAVKCINALNQTFVDVVRSSGGNNTSRYLMVPGYCASLQGATHPDFVLPADIEGNENRILLSVHAYTPYAFALQPGEEGGSTDRFRADDASDTRDIDHLMDTLYEAYISKGTGVVIGEFGARDKGGNTQDRADFYAYYIAAARQRGITCCIWDNNAFTGSGELFGFFDRQTLTFPYPEMLESLMENCE